jgi:hypothetical protein
MKKSVVGKMGSCHIDATPFVFLPNRPPRDLAAIPKLAVSGRFDEPEERVGVAPEHDEDEVRLTPVVFLEWIFREAK